MFQSPVDSFSEPPGGSRMVIENRIVMIRHHPTANQRLYDEVWFSGISRTLIGSRALAAYGDVDGPSAANNHPWSRKYTARLLRRSDTSSSAHGCAGTRTVRLEDAGSVG